MARHRTYLITDGGLRRYPLTVAKRRGRHRADDWYARRVPTPLRGPAPGRHRATRRRRGSAGRPRRRLIRLGLTAVAAVAAVSVWFTATGAVAMAAMVR